MAKSKTVNCINLADNAQWNTTSSILQTWNGSTWLPNEDGAYDTTPSSSECRYKCSTGFGWDGNFCVASANGQCGASQATSSYTYPTNKYCTVGSKTDVDKVGNDGTFDWTCSGMYGGTTVSCLAFKSKDAVCGSADGDTLASKPMFNLCSVGTASAVTGSGPWNWTCNGPNNGADATCSANAIPVNGLCGPSDGGTFASKPTFNLCTIGSASSVGGTGPWNWSCFGTGGGTNDNCTASKQVLYKCLCNNDPNNTVWDNQITDLTGQGCSAYSTCGNCGNGG